MVINMNDTYKMNSFDELQFSMNVYVEIVSM